jgi:hypothetical protein
MKPLKINKSFKSSPCGEPFSKLEELQNRIECAYIDNNGTTLKWDDTIPIRVEDLCEVVGVLTDLIKVENQKRRAEDKANHREACNCDAKYLIQTTPFQCADEEGRYYKVSFYCTHCEHWWAECNEIPDRHKDINSIYPTKVSYGITTARGTPCTCNPYFFQKTAESNRMICPNCKHWWFEEL